jgi:NADPH:quinone reductase-like Zn-dependent oxidoreductase
MTRIVQASSSRSKNVRSVSHRPNQADLVCLGELLEAGKVAPVIDKQYRLREVAEALRYYAGGHVRGKVVITV